MGNVKVFGYYISKEDGDEFIHYEKDGKFYLTNGVRNWSTELEQRMSVLTSVKVIDLTTMGRGLQNHLPNEAITKEVLELLRDVETVKDSRYETIVINSNQIVGDINKEEKKLAKIITPDGFTYLYKKDNLRKSDFNNNKVYFSVPSEYIFHLSKSQDTGEIDNDGKKVYQNYEKDVTASELKLMYSRLNVKQAVKENSKFLTIEISKNRAVQTFQTEQGEFTRILAPNGFSFIRPSNQIHPSKKDDAKVYFALPRNDFEIRMTRSVNTGEVDSNNNPIYKQEAKLVTPEELKDLFCSSEEVITIAFTKNQIVVKFKSVSSWTENEAEEMEFSKILTPMGYTFIKPSRQIVYNTETDKYELHMKAYQMVKLCKSVKLKEGEYTNEAISVTARELSEMINEEALCRRKQRAR
jgi:hypothetical protein